MVDLTANMVKDSSCTSEASCCNVFKNKKYCLAFVGYFCFSFKGLQNKDHCLVFKISKVHEFAFVILNYTFS